MPEIKKIFTVEDVSKLFGCHVETIRRAIRDGDLAAAKIGRGLKISRDDLNAYWELKGGRHKLLKDEDETTEGSNLIKDSSRTPAKKPKRKPKTPSALYDEILSKRRNGIPLKGSKPLFKRLFKIRIKDLNESPGDIARYLNSVSLQNFDGKKWKVADIKAILES